MGYVRLDPFRVAQECWKESNIRGIKVPAWYCVLYGTSPWMLQASCSKLREQQKALAFIVRFNYIADVVAILGYFDPNYRLKPARNFSRYLRFYRMSLMDTISGSSRLSWGHSPFYNWRGVLSCTLRRYVDLALPALVHGRPSKLLDRLRSAMRSVDMP